MNPPEYSTLQPIRQPFAVMVNPPHCILRSKIISNNKVIPKSSKKSTPRDHLHSRRDFEDHKIEYPNSRWCLWKLKKNPFHPTRDLRHHVNLWGGGLCSNGCLMTDGATAWFVLRLSHKTAKFQLVHIFHNSVRYLSHKMYLRFCNH